MKILNKLTLKHIKLNRKRSIVTIIGIMLSTAMMLTIGTMFASLAGSIKEDAILKDGEYHVSYRLIDDDKFDSVVNNKNVDFYYMSKMIGVNISDDANYYSLNEGDQRRLDQLSVIEGRLPQNNKEIIVDEKFLVDNKDLKIGDKFTFKAGDAYTEYEGERVDLKYSGYLRSDANYYHYKETKEYGDTSYVVENYKDYEYTVVGTYDDFDYYTNSPRTFFTLNDNMSSKDAVVFIAYNDLKNIYDIQDETIKNNVPTEIYLDSYYNPEFNYNYEPISISTVNTQLVMFYSGFSYTNINVLFGGFLAFILSILSIGCIVVIYNSFAISAIDRKREFGIYSSLGATGQQLKYSMYFEALILGGIGIILGMILSQVVSVLLIKLILHYTEIFSKQGTGFINISLHMNWLLYIIPLIFMVLVIYLSVLTPAKRSSKTSAIDLIRQKDDIKLTNKDIKTNFIARKLFKAEGVIAHKNMKRNKKRYRITLISLVTSVFMFVSFSTFSSLYNQALAFSPTGGFDVNINLFYEDDKSKDEAIKSVMPLLEDKDYLFTKETWLDLPLVDENLSDDYQNYLLEFYEGVDLDEIHVGLQFKSIPDKEFEQIKSDYNRFDVDNIIINKAQVMKSTKDEMNLKEYNIFNTEKNINVELYVDEKEVEMTLRNNLFVDDVSIHGVSLTPDITSSYVLVLTSESRFNSLEKQYQSKLDDREGYSTFENTGISFGVKTDDPQAFLDSFEKQSINNAYAYSGVIELQMITNIITLVKIIVYLFIAVTTLIGITSVFNTIYTSIILRRREFAMLRSIGMDTKGFNRILIYESILFSIKTILIAFPLSVISVLLFNVIISNTIEFTYLIVPWSAYLISIIAVITIMLSVTMYSSKNIKKENILEALRKELS